MNTVNIRVHNEFIPVPAHHIEAGLAVAEPDDGVYTITHIVSGQAIGKHWYLPYERVKRGIDVLIATGIDWTQPVEVVKEAVARIGLAELSNRVRIAIRPPKRVNHGADARIRRRPLPYEALVRRTASHEAHEVGLPDMCHDLNHLKWRSDYYGTLTRPKRQPCTRFVVRKAARLGLARRIARRASGRCYRAIHHPTADGTDMYRLIWVDGRIVCDLNQHKWMKRGAYAYD